jgi:glucose/arabinose dehydrogenase
MARKRLEITSIAPHLGVPGGEALIACRGFVPGLPDRAKVLFGTVEARITSASEDRVVVRVPESPHALGVSLQVDGDSSPVFPFTVATRLAADLHPVASPVIAPDGSVITTNSGSRGEKVEHPLVRVTRAGEVVPFACEVLNPTGLAFGPDGQLYLTSRADGVVLRYRDFENLEVVADELGIPCGLAFDPQGVLHVADRAGTIYRIDRRGQREAFAHVEPSVSAHHLLFDAGGRLLVTGPTFSTRDAVWVVDRSGRAEAIVTGVGRPQGMSRLPGGGVLVTAAYRGKKGVFRLTPEGGLEHHVAAPTLVGVAAAPDGTLVLADGGTLYRVEPGTAAVV